MENCYNCNMCFFIFVSYWQTTKHTLRQTQLPSVQHRLAYTNVHLFQLERAQKIVLIRFSIKTQTKSIANNKNGMERLYRNEFDCSLACWCTVVARMCSSFAVVVDGFFSTSWYLLIYFYQLFSINGNVAKVRGW